MDPKTGGMNQEQLTQAIARKFYLSQAESRRIIKFILSKIKEDLRNGRRVYFRGFGSFIKEKRPGRRSSHPKTGKIIWIPSKTDVVFNPSKLLLETLQSR